MPRRNHTLSEKFMLDVDELTDDSGGTADGTVETVGDTSTDASTAINNNFAELTAKYNELLDRLKADV